MAGHTIGVARLAEISIPANNFFILYKNNVYYMGFLEAMRIVDMDDFE